MNSSSYLHYHITTELKDQLSVKSQQEHTRLYDAVYETKHSSGESSALTLCQAIDV